MPLSDSDAFGDELRFAGRIRDAARFHSIADDMVRDLQLLKGLLREGVNFSAFIFDFIIAKQTVRNEPRLLIPIYAGKSCPQTALSFT